jgi:hypothetical protein
MWQAWGRTGKTKRGLVPDAPAGPQASARGSLIACVVLRLGIVAEIGIGCSGR